MATSIDEREALFRPEVLIYQRERKTSSAVISQSGAISAMAWISGGLLCLALLVLCLIRYKETEQARGILEYQSASLKTKSPVASRVLELNVVEGDIAQKGQTLMILTTDVLNGDGKNQQHALIDKLSLDEKQLHQKIEMAKRLYLVEKERLTTSIFSLQETIAMLNKEAELLHQKRDLSSNALASFSKLLQEANLSQAQFDREAAADIDLRRDQISVVGKISEISSNLHDRHLQLELHELNFETEKLELDKQLLGVVQELKSLRQETLVTIQAPRGGVVASVAVKEGEPISAGQTLVTINPRHGALEATLYVPSSLVGRIYTEQELLLAFDAFPTSEFGFTQGTVTAISQASIDPRETLLPIAGISEPVFKVSAKLDQHYVEGPQVYPLTSGIELSADFVIEDLTLLEFIFKPVLKLKGKVI